MARMLLREKAFVACMCLTIAVTTSNWAIMATFFNGWASSRGMSSVCISIIFTSFQIGKLLTSMVAGHLANLFGRRAIMSTGVALVAVTGICIGLTPDLAAEDVSLMASLFTLPRFVQGCGAALTQLSVVAILSDAFPSHRGLMVGTATSMEALGYFVGPPIGGLLYSASGFRLPFVSLACVVGANLGAILCLYPTRSAARDSAARGTAARDSASRDSASRSATQAIMPADAVDSAMVPCTTLDGGESLSEAGFEERSVEERSVEERSVEVRSAEERSMEERSAEESSAKDRCAPSSKLSLDDPSTTRSEAWSASCTTELRHLPSEVWWTCTAAAVYMSKWAWWEIHFAAWCVREFGASVASASGYLSLVAACFGLGVPLAGSLGDRLGAARRFDLLAGALSALVLLYAAMGPWQVAAIGAAGRYVAFLAYLALDGALCCLVEPQLLPQLLACAEARAEAAGSARHSAKRTNLIASLGQAAMNLGMVAGPFVAVPVVDAYGFRGALAAWAIPLAIVSAWAPFVRTSTARADQRRRGPRQRPGGPLRRQSTDDSRAEASESSASSVALSIAV